MTTKLACKHCKSPNIIFRKLLLAVRPVQGKVYSHWYDCRNCYYSSNGRTTLAQAEADAVKIEVTK